MDFIKEIKNLSCDDQMQIANAIAANIGYKLVEEDNERSIQIKAIIELVKNNQVCVVIDNDYDKNLIREGLERLLK